MARYSSAVASWTPVTAADGAITTSNGAHALRAAAALDLVKITEIAVMGEGTTGNVNTFALRRHTTHSSTPTNRVPAPMNPASVASVFQGYIAASTMGTTAALATIQHVLGFSINTNGGIFRRSFAPGDEPWIMTATANNDEVSLATIAGTGVVSSDYICEEI